MEGGCGLEFGRTSPPMPPNLAPSMLCAPKTLRTYPARSSPIFSRHARAASSNKAKFRSKRPIFSHRIFCAGRRIFFVRISAAHSLPICRSGKAGSRPQRSHSPRLRSISRRRRNLFLSGIDERLRGRTFVRADARSARLNWAVRLANKIQARGVSLGMLIRFFIVGCLREFRPSSIGGFRPAGVSVFSKTHIAGDRCRAAARARRRALRRRPP